MRDRQIFERVKEHLLKQGKQSINSGGTCAYRGRQGRKCALGILIPDSKYSRQIEYASLETMSDQLEEGSADDCQAALAQTLVECGFPPSQWGLLKELQMIHDMPHSPWRSQREQWESNLADLATRHGWKK